METSGRNMSLWKHLVPVPEGLITDRSHLRRTRPAATAGHCPTANHQGASVGHPYNLGAQRCQPTMRCLRRLMGLRALVLSTWPWMVTDACWLHSSPHTRAYFTWSCTCKHLSINISPPQRRGDGKQNILIVHSREPSSCWYQKYF